MLFNIETKKDYDIQARIRGGEATQEEAEAYYIKIMKEDGRPDWYIEDLRPYMNQKDFHYYRATGAYSYSYRLEKTKAHWVKQIIGIIMVCIFGLLEIYVSVNMFLSGFLDKPELESNVTPFMAIGAVGIFFGAWLIKMGIPSRCNVVWDGFVDFEEKPEKNYDSTRCFSCEWYKYCDRKSCSYRAKN